MAATESHVGHTQAVEQIGLPGTMPRPINVTMVGAGSFFTNAILKDVVLIPGNQGGELRLIDIDADRVQRAAKLMVKIIEETGQSDKWTVRYDTDRMKLLPGTDFIVNSIEVSGVECVRFDNDIPLSYGISQCIGDTIGPGGLFKGLRTIPVWLDILRDAEKVCPDALVLNYTNPMNMLCLASARATKMKVVGLCHSVQGTSHLLAKWSGVPYEEMRWECAGINHLAWFTKLQDGAGNDLYPKLMEMAADRDSEFANAEPVRSDMMLHFGAFITESSGHLSEYLPYYRKRKELRDKYTKEGYLGGESFYADNWPNWRKGYDAHREEILAGTRPVDLNRSWEYGAWIIEAVEKNQPYRIHGNVAPNQGLIENLPADGCVEVACLVDQNGVQPTKFGRLPKPMAAICDSNMRMFDIAVDACIEKSKELAIQALYLDPLTSAVLCPAEIKEMTLKMFDAEKEYLPGYR
ncbi:MAG: alpha-glucosidase/alpha-galactosidase [Fimbriimonadaceae bacterium]